MEAYTGGISTRKVDVLVEALGGTSGISKSEVSRICQGLDDQVCQPTRKKSSLPTRKSPHSWGAFFPLFRPWVGSLPGAVEQLQTVCDASLK
jgi:hypothetical protein